MFKSDSLVLTQAVAMQLYGQRSGFDIPSGAKRVLNQQACIEYWRTRMSKG